MHVPGAGDAADETDAQDPLIPSSVAGAAVEGLVVCVRKSKQPALKNAANAASTKQLLVFIPGLLPGRPIGTTNADRQAE